MGFFFQRKLCEWPECKVVLQGTWDLIDFLLSNSSDPCGGTERGSFSCMTPTQESHSQEGIIIATVEHHLSIVRIVTIKKKSSESVEKRELSVVTRFLSLNVLYEWNHYRCVVFCDEFLAFMMHSTTDSSCLASVNGLLAIFTIVWGCLLKKIKRTTCLPHF